MATFYTFSVLIALNLKPPLITGRSPVSRTRKYPVFVSVEFLRSHDPTNNIQLDVGSARVYHAYILLSTQINERDSNSAYYEC